MLDHPCARTRPPDADGHLRTSVVVCAYTTARWSLLRTALDSVARQTHPVDQLVLVVDHCPELADLAAAALPASVLVVPNTGSRGLSSARNSGVAVVSGDVVAFLDDDAEAAPDWLAEMLPHYAEPDVVSVGSLVVPNWEAGRPAWFPPEFDWVVGCSYTGQPTTTADVRNPIGAGMSFRRNALLAVGGFSTTVGRVGATPTGCEETEVAIRIARQVPGARVVLEPRSVVHHTVPAARSGWSYFHRRCWAEGISKAEVSRLGGSGPALSAERQYVRRTLPAAVAAAVGDGVRTRAASPLARAGAVGAGLAITTAAFAAARLRYRLPSNFVRRDPPMPRTSTAVTPWLNFDVHGRVGLRVAADAAPAAQLRTMFACFATDDDVREDIVVDATREPTPQAAVLEDELAYTGDAVTFLRENVQIVRHGDGYRVHGPGELLTAVLPLLDRAMVERGAAMIHAATVGYRGLGIALPAAGGTGKTSTVAKLMRREGFSFMGDDWAFLTDDGTLLNYEKPMFIKPHHRPIYPHLFEGVRRPLVPVALSRPVGRLTTVVHPFVIRYPRLADFSRRWSPEHRMVRAADALPGVEVTRAAPLALAMYVERYDGAHTRLVEQSQAWMVDRMLGNFHIEMPDFSRAVVDALAATSILPQRALFEEKGTVLTKALDGRPCFLLQVPSSYSPDQASDDVVRFLDSVLPEVVDEPAARSSAVAR